MKNKSNNNISPESDDTEDINLLLSTHIYLLSGHISIKYLIKLKLPH